MKPLGLKKVNYFKGKNRLYFPSTEKSGYINFWENFSSPNKKAFRRENKNLINNELLTMNNYTFADIYTDQSEWYEVK